MCSRLPLDFIVIYSDLSLLSSINYFSRSRTHLVVVVRIKIMLEHKKLFDHTGTSTTLIFSLSLSIKNVSLIAAYKNDHHVNV